MNEELHPGLLPAGLRDLAVGGAALLAEDQGKPDWAIEGLAEAGDVVMVTGREMDDDEDEAGSDPDDQDEEAEATEDVVERHLAGRSRVITWWKFIHQGAGTAYGFAAVGQLVQ